jgi:hypothetical protein
MPPEPGHPGSGRAYMAAPIYASACQSCHVMQFDSHFAESVPHDTPQVVHTFVVNKLTQYIKEHPEAIRETPRPVRLMFGGTVSREPQTVRVAHNAEEWIKLRTEDAENLLWRKTCLQCHTLNYSQTDKNGLAGLPQVAPSNIKPVWLPNSVFSHYAHASVECKSCHVKTASSQETSDVLVPSIKTCQECHNGEPTKIGQAQNGCFLCHSYHNWKQRDQQFIPSHSIDQLRGSKEPASAPTKQLGASVSQLFFH